MAKVAGIGKRGHLVVCVKPTGWQGPRTLAILREAGYEEKRWTQIVERETGVLVMKVDETKCRDDAIYKQAVA